MLLERTEASLSIRVEQVDVMANGIMVMLEYWVGIAVAVIGDLTTLCRVSQIS